MTRKKRQGRRKHIPMRRCVACRQSLAKRLLVRIVSSPEGVVIDPGGKMAGRGVYLCHDPACWEKAIASKDMISFALHTRISDDERAALLNYSEQELREEPGGAVEG